MSPWDFSYSDDFKILMKEIIEGGLETPASSPRIQGIREIMQQMMGI